MSITFVTSTRPVSSFVSWGYSPDALTESVRPRSSVNYIPTSGWHNEAVISSISCETPKVYYAVTADETSSSIHSFSRAPCDGKAAFDIAIVGDMGFKDSVQRPTRLPLPRGGAATGLFEDWSAQFSLDRLAEWKERGEIGAVWHL